VQAYMYSSSKEDERNARDKPHVSLFLVACVALEKRGSAAKSAMFTITSLITNVC
jgi:hypothetical protein